MSGGYSKSKQWQRPDPSRYSVGDIFRSTDFVPDERGPALDDATALEAEHDDRFDRRVLGRTGGPAEADQVTFRHELVQNDSRHAPSRVEELDDEATRGAARRLALDRIVIDEIFMEELLGQLRFVLVDRLFENADSRRLVCLRANIAPPFFRID